MFRTLLTSNNRVRMNSNTADIIIHMLQIDNIGTLLEVMSEEQAKDIATAVKNAARNLPDALRAPSFTINVNIPVDAAVDEARRQELLDAAIAQAEQAEQTRITNARANAMQNVAFVSPESATMFHAVWYWATLQARMGRQVTSNNNVCSSAALKKMVERLKYEAQMAKESTATSPPGIMKNLNKFRDWYQGFFVYMRAKRGAARIPLVYVFRDHEIVTAAMRAEIFQTTDEEYIKLFELSGTYYEVDNKTVFNELNALVVGGPLESIVKRYEKKEDGRNAVLSIVAYANGPEAVAARTNSALTVIQATKYHTKSRNITLDDYFNRLRINYEILETNGSPVSENMKVTQTLHGITEPSLVTAKTVVMNDITNISTFEDFVSRFKNAASVSLAASSSSQTPRNVSDTIKEDSFTSRKSFADNKTVKDSDLHSGTYSAKGWKLLTRSQQEKVREMRKTASKKRQRENAAQSQENKDDEKPDNAGTKFGRGAKTEKKDKS